MFSSRLPWSTPSNTLSERAAALRGQYLDLTESNPTRVGLAYPEPEMLAAFARPEMLTYEPDPRGLPGARAAVDADFLTASTSESYSWLFKLLCDPGDEILAPRPSYPLFEFLAGLEGVRVKQYPLRYAEGWFVDFPALERELSPRTKAILAVHPNNPTGSFLHAFELERFTGYGLPLISDEVFASYAHVESVLPTLGGNGRVLTFVLDGLSKSAGMPQMKAGWIRVSGPGAEEARERLELIADTYLSVSTPVQWALPGLLRASVHEQILERVRGNLARVPGALRVEGGWCAILRMPASRTDEEWAGYLLEEKRVLTQPGYFFDLEGGPYLVVSLLTEPGTFAEGLQRITTA
jgi:alanine-synthesizing transaminase